MYKKIKSKIKTVRNNKDGRVLIENFISLSVLKVIGYVFPLLTLPYLSRVIGVDSFGELAFAASIIVYFETLTNYGFNYTAVRDIAQNREDLDKVSMIFYNVMYSKVFLMLISLVIFTVCIYSIPLLYEKRVLFWYSFLLIPGHILFPDWFFQAMEKMKFITIINFVSKLLFTLLVFVVIKEKSDFIYQPLLIALGYLVSGVISFFIAKKEFKLKFFSPNINQIRNTLKSGFRMFISLFFPNLYSNFSVTLLGFLGGAYATGIYSGGYKFINLTDQITAMLSQVFFPYLSRRIDKHGFYVKLTGAISILMGLILFFGADLIVHILYGPEFYDSVIVIKIMALSPFFLFLMNTYGPNYLVIKGREDILLNIVLFCSIGGFILSCVAVHLWSYIGVAITLTSVWAVRGILTWYYAKKIR